jgi:hypothetical protein
MKRFRIPWLVDVALSEDAAEIESLAQNPTLDRAYADRSVPVNGAILKRVRETLELDGNPFPTVAPKDAQGRKEAQEALWRHLSDLAPQLSTGPEELESLAAFVRGEGPAEGCGPLIQQVVGRLFAPDFEATPASWSAALVLDKAPRTMNPILLVWWAATGRVQQAKRLLAGKVGDNLAALHAIGIAVHNIVSGVILMRELYRDPSTRASILPAEAASRCLVAPSTVIRQPTSSGDSDQFDFKTSTLVLLSLRTANEKSPSQDAAFLRNTWSRCPAEQWVPALLEGIWRRASSPA